MGLQLLKVNGGVVALGADTATGQDLASLFATAGKIFGQDVGRSARDQYLDYTFITIQPGEALPQPVWRRQESGHATAEMSVHDCERFCRFIEELHEQRRPIGRRDPGAASILERLSPDAAAIYDRIVSPD